MGGIKAGEGYWVVSNPNDEIVKMQYHTALSKALALFEDAVKLVIRAEDRVGLASLKQEVGAIFDKAENTLKLEE